MSKKENQPQVHARHLMRALPFVLTGGFALAVYAMLFVLRGFWPFGNGSVLVTDLYSQYTPLLYRFYDVVTGTKNLFMEFSLALGTPLFSDTINEVINPLNYVLLLFGRDRLYLAQNLLPVLYGTAAAVTSHVALRYFFATGTGRLCGSGAAAGAALQGAGGMRSCGFRAQLWETALSLSYALSGYAAYNYQIIKWMIFPVLFPLYVMALHRLLTKRKALPYTLLLAYHLMLSVQLGVMTLLFTLFATAFYLQWEKKTTAAAETSGETRQALADVAEAADGVSALPMLGLSTLAALLLASPVLLPALYTLVTSARAGEIASYTNIMRRHGLDDIADRLFQIAQPALLGMLAAVALAYRKRRSNRSFILRYLLLWNLFLWFTALFEPANLLWHLGSYICFPVRYAYMSLFSVALTVRYLCTAAAPGGAMPSAERPLSCPLSRASVVPDRGRFLRHGAETTGSAECPAQPERSGCIRHRGRRRPEKRTVALCALSLAALAGAFVVTLRHELPITQIFSSLVITAYPRILLYVILAMALLFAASVAAATSAAEPCRRRARPLCWRPASLVWLSAAVSLCLQLFVYLPESYGIRGMNREAYERMTETAASRTAEEGAFTLTPFDENLPRNAALVNRTRTITSYLPAVPEKTQSVLSALGYDTYWMATYDTGGSEETWQLLNHAYLLDGAKLQEAKERYEPLQEYILQAVAAYERENVSDEARRADDVISVHERSGTVTAMVRDAKDGDCLHLPLITHDGWTVTQRDSDGTRIVYEAEAVQGAACLFTIPLLEGDNEITLSYTPPYLKAGCILLIPGLLLLFILQRFFSKPAAASGGAMPSAERFLRHGAETTGSAECPAQPERSGCIHHRDRRRSENGATDRFCRALFRLLLAAAILGIYLLPLGGLAYYTVRELLTGKEETEAYETPAHALLKAASTEDGVLVEMAGENLMRARAVTVSADSTETENFPAALVRDGDDESQSSRWSSANDRDACDHWLRADFPEEETIALLRVTWERDNMTDYAVETSADGQTWTEVMAFSEAPEELVQDIRFPEAVRTKHLRLHFRDVRREEEDATLYYQNVSVLELEAYDEASLEQFFVEAPVIPSGKNRTLTTPAVPEGYALAFGGADYEMLIDEEGNIADTYADVEAEIGFTLSYEGGQAALPGMRLTIPASEGGAARVDLPEGIKVAECAAVPSTGSGTGAALLYIDASCAVTTDVQTDADASAFAQNAGIFTEELAALTATLPLPSTDAGTGAGRVLLTLTDERDKRVPGDEAFLLEIGTAAQPTDIILTARTVQGLRWGEVTLLELIEKTEGALPRCVIRDYPRYEVRGFGLDVARRIVPVELLKRMVEALSRQKMNTLHLHLNDNRILAEHTFDGTLEGAYDVYAGFRLESSLRNDAGEGITSADDYYTDEDWRELIAYAQALGVTIVPEIDTPAHALAFTSVFPDIGVRSRPEMADTFDLSSEDALHFAKNLWNEYLAEEDALFADCPMLHLGMDEYFGDGEEYLAYANGLTEYVAGLAPEKELIVWASLDWYELPYALPETVTMQVWSPEWCDVRRAFDKGHGIINSLSHHLYIIPGTGQELQEFAEEEEDWAPNVFDDGRHTYTIPAYSAQMKGACYMLWNDHSGEGGSLRGEYDDEVIFTLFETPLAPIAARLW
ncbi:MAG: YfhO family protein [Lachnospiraceae bacterium]|nr:YfhO family protein [Lachnospiraceae bacterium]